MTEVRTIDPIRKLHTFNVTGPGPFPLDMLRYDSCWPATEARDSHAIGTTFTARREKGNFTIHLTGIREPTVGRWESFGWKVGE